MQSSFSRFLSSLIDFASNKKMKPKLLMTTLINQYLKTIKIIPKILYNFFKKILKFIELKDKRLDSWIVMH